MNTCNHYNDIIELFDTYPKINRFDRLLKNNNIKNEDIDLNRCELYILLYIIEIHPYIICKYIQKLYLNNKFEEERLKRILPSRLYNSVYSNKYIIYYFNELPLHIYQDVLYNNTHLILHINIKVYYELREFCQFLIL